jgi:hypothetical protein
LNHASFERRALRERTASPRENLLIPANLGILPFSGMRFCLPSLRKTGKKPPINGKSHDEHRTFGRRLKDAVASQSTDLRARHSAIALILSSRSWYRTC